MLDGWRNQQLARKLAFSTINGREKAVQALGDRRAVRNLAREVATTDVLTGGRLPLGLGAGHLKWEFDEAGIAWEPFGARVQRLKATIEQLRRGFARTVTRSSGRCVTTSTSRCCGPSSASASAAGGLR
jgi:hypothetical protein